MRPLNGSKPVDMTVLRRAFEDKRLWTSIGVVVKREGDNSHFQVIDEDGSKDVLVEVDLMPEGTPLSARLGCGAGSQGYGVWRIPPPGTEVALLLPMGGLEADPMIVATLSSGDMPKLINDGDSDTLVVANSDRVVIYSKDDKVFLGSEDGTGTKKAARVNDTVNQGTLQVAGSGANITTITWVPPGGGTPVVWSTGTPGPTPIPKGKIDSGSDKVEIK